VIGMASVVVLLQFRVNCFKLFVLEFAFTVVCPSNVRRAFTFLHYRNSSAICLGIQRNTTVVSVGLICFVLAFFGLFAFLISIIFCWLILFFVGYLG
jgi:hypothetical protein